MKAPSLGCAFMECQSWMSFFGGTIWIHQPSSPQAAPASICGNASHPTSLSPHNSALPLLALASFLKFDNKQEQEKLKFSAVCFSHDKVKEQWEPHRESLLTMLPIFITFWGSPWSSSQLSQRLCHFSLIFQSEGHSGPCFCLSTPLPRVFLNKNSWESSR